MIQCKDFEGVHWIFVCFDSDVQLKQEAGEIMLDQGNARLPSCLWAD